MISFVGLSGSKIVKTTMDINIKLTSREYDEHLNVNKDYKRLHDVSLYRRLIWKLLYLTIARADISFYVQHLSQFMQDPKVSHFEIVIRILRYVKKEPGNGVLLSSEYYPRLIGYCDSDRGVCIQTRKYVIVFCIMLGKSLISLKVKKTNNNF